MNRKHIRILSLVLGLAFMSLGALGIFLPVLPTTPFMLLAAFFFLRSSKSLYFFLLSSPLAGRNLYIYMKYRSVRKKDKILALALLWLTLGLSIFLVEPLYLKLLLGGIGTAVSIHILRFRNLTPVEEEAACQAHARFLQRRRDRKAGTSRHRQGKGGPA